MIGGVIIGLTKKPGVIRVNAADCPHYPKHGRGDECPRPDTGCVCTDGKRSDGSDAPLAVGDSFWWQSGSCYWTPAANRSKPDGKDGVDYDIRLRKIVYSH
jgi:hypothetical protein